MGFELDYNDLKFRILVEEDHLFRPLDPRFQKLRGFNLKDIETGKLSFCSLTISTNFNNEEHVFFSCGIPLSYQKGEEVVMDELCDVLEANSLLDRISEKVQEYHGDIMPPWRID
ncbi:MAG: hypothetical protein COW00_01680 [Bdellovibrio sp. CG12_big_fil_rev_8_21_14_0_65_39_13]|nr:MAG: hypothetical protein COW78_03430 [Bdellovibrio sp. CG22_combo_CG10-13_8_21_14_all_39_27]PIQ62420.1 MAG: hypothetical protein COW00_01680 [Bdellovibrio sp. CG12_big_fil_rev_8_21_14_0_65_39_13]PIR34087.1 MAG: hypothetical protein COV37_14160 [Bdellovibrio sp. CG11_big_fil_rev_8_21_14_0_20_39_38]PJB53032.1 MAG: hypothetical protein CO099_09355 [Bdellovibrio sp. CG_4_9_14_3_um_filter_39_7]